MGLGRVIRGVRYVFCCSLFTVFYSVMAELEKVCKTVVVCGGGEYGINQHLLSIEVLKLNI